MSSIDECDGPTASESAAAKAEHLVLRINPADLLPAWLELEQALADYESDTGGTIDELLPAEVDVLAFRVPGSSRAKAITKALLCGKQGEIRAMVDATMQSGMPALISGLLVALNLPDSAAGIAAVFAAVICVRGVDAFCEDN